MIDLRLLLIVIACIAGPPAAAADPRPGHYRVDSAASTITVLVYRGGLLRGLGHNHVVSATQIGGSIDVAADLSASHARFEVPVAGLVLDDPAKRSEAGDAFPGTLSDGDVAATRRNMLGPRLLNLSDDDRIVLRSGRIAGSLPTLSVAIELTIRGTLQTVDFPLTIETDGDTLHLRGERELAHRELGLKPFRAALGALSVRQQMEIRYDLRAHRETAAR